MGLEDRFDITFAAKLAIREKQIQQSYRPVIGVHKWFARRPGTLFRNLLLAEFNGREAPASSFFRSHELRGVIADPFMGGGTTLMEANRLGFHVVGADINPMAYWIVRQEMEALDDVAFADQADQVANDISSRIGDLYTTDCLQCARSVPVKYFLWVKTIECPHCAQRNDLFPGYLLAEATRHPKNVLACSDCTKLVELDRVPTRDQPATCPHCGGHVQIDGPAKRNRIRCRSCAQEIRYPVLDATEPPIHRMWAIEYHCPSCKPSHRGRFFKSPSRSDLDQVGAAKKRLNAEIDLPIPMEEIATGDETKRLLRWGYHRYRDMFSDRQLLGLGLLFRRLEGVTEPSIRHALLTVFSDSLRYQNMLCRYDTYALKVQDIFSVHGFPVGLIQCENNLIGIPKVGSGSFRHFVEKYRRAKAYCRQPFETTLDGPTKARVDVAGEVISAQLVRELPHGPEPQALIRNANATSIALPPNSLDGVFTDPPYFANVQYAELMDFCYVWLRQGLRAEFPEFSLTTTRSAGELTGNLAMGRGLEHFADGLSGIFTHYARALRPAAPFVFTYHHNDVEAYAPIVLALLDAGLHCSAVFPAPAEMEASLHISNTASSILDSVFVCRPLVRRAPRQLPDIQTFKREFVRQCAQITAGNVRLSLGDARCMFSGHMARFATAQLEVEWPSDQPISKRLARVTEELHQMGRRYRLAQTVESTVTGLSQMELFKPKVPRAASV